MIPTDDAAQLWLTLVALVGKAGGKVILSEADLRAAEASLDLQIDMNPDGTLTLEVRG